MAELNNQLPQSVAGDEDASGESRVVEDPEPISTEFPVEVFQSENENVGDSVSDLHPYGINDDDDGVQNCTFTELLSTGIQVDE
ncbi:hypothetical protein HanPI659440_Chr17g0690061 [Helianthus annuus]|nr:hypothetical protein HanPI659440_Chr17g0690061 [Helianthus annuus]